MPKTLTFYSNPEVGAVHMPEEAFVFIGARLDVGKSAASGKNIFIFSHDPISISPTHPHVAYFASLCRHGDILAGDEETVEFCRGGSIADEFRMKAAAAAAAELAKVKIAEKAKVDAALAAQKVEAEKNAKAILDARRKSFEEEVARRRAARESEAQNQPASDGAADAKKPKSS